MPPENEPEHDEPKQIQLMRQVVEMSAQQTRMSTERTQQSVQRTEQSAERCYQTAERTLSVWVRTALAMMVFGIAIDRFGLLLHRLPTGTSTASHLTHALLNSLSTACGMALVALSIFMALATGARFLAYALAWRRQHKPPAHHGPYLAPFFALMVAFFGAALLVIMILFAE